MLLCPVGFEQVPQARLSWDPTVSSDSMSVTMGDPNGQSQSNFVQKKFNNGSFWAVLAGTSFL